MTETVRDIIDEKIIEACARAAHEANRAYCVALGDMSQTDWHHAPDWQQSSARNGVPGALAGNTPRQSHESWLAEKVATGWLYGPVKDPVKKEHPCMVPYDELPLAQKAKDEIFVGVVRLVARAMGVRVATPMSPQALSVIGAIEATPSLVGLTHAKILRDELERIGS